MKRMMLIAAVAGTLVTLTGAASKAASTAEIPVSVAVDGLTGATPVQPARRDTTTTKKRTAKKKQAKKSNQSRKSKGCCGKSSGC